MGWLEDLVQNADSGSWCKLSCLLSSLLAWPLYSTDIFLHCTVQVLNYRLDIVCCTLYNISHILHTAKFITEIICPKKFQLWALPACLTSSFALRPCDPHKVYLLVFFFVSMMQESTMHVSMMSVSMMHVSMCLYPWCMCPCAYIHDDVSIMHVSLIHVFMMHISMILDSWFWHMHVCMMHVLCFLIIDACMYGVWI